MAWTGRDIKDHLVPAPCCDHHWIRLPVTAPPTWRHRAKDNLSLWRTSFVPSTDLAMSMLLTGDRCACSLGLNNAGTRSGLWISSKIYLGYSHLCQYQSRGAVSWVLFCSTEASPGVSPLAKVWDPAEYHISLLHMSMLAKLSRRLLVYM